MPDDMDFCESRDCCTRRGGLARPAGDAPCDLESQRLYLASLSVVLYRESFDPILSRAEK